MIPRALRALSGTQPMSMVTPGHFTNLETETTDVNLNFDYTMARVCICCKYCMSKDASLSDISLFRFPKSDVLLQKWLFAIDTEKKITGSSRICSRHFKEDDFRYSVVGGKRYLKQEVIPSLYLNGESMADMVLDNKNTIIKENQPTNTVIEYNAKAPKNESLNIVESHVEANRDNALSNRTLLPPAGLNEPEKRGKKHLYDVRWEEISTSSVQAKIYWEVVIKKIKRQKQLMKTLRQRIRRLEKQKQDLQTLIKNDYR